MNERIETKVIDIPLEKMIPDPENLRENFDIEDLKALSENIIENGQMDPIQVFNIHEDKYQIFDGERRWRAFKLTNLKSIAAIVIQKPTQEEFIFKRVSRAMQSRSLTPQEEVRALENALEALGIKSKTDEWGKTAKKLGLPPQLLRDRMRIAKLTKNIRNEFEMGDLDLSAAQAIGRIEGQKRQEEVTTFIKENQLHTRFVGTKFIEKLLQYPDSPILEVYTIAQSELRDPTRISHKVKKDEMFVDRFEDMLADLRRSITWIEASGREGLLVQLSERNDLQGIRRLVDEIQRLDAMCRALLKHIQKDYSEPSDESIKQLE